MFRFVFGVCAVFLSACATMQPPLSGEPANSLKSGKAVVAFFDGVEQIKYSRDIYLVLAVAKEASYSTYSGLWNSNADVSGIHTTELSKIGIQAKSLYEALSPEEIAEIQPILKTMDVSSRMKASNNSNELASEKTAPHLKQKLKDMLLSKGFDYLFFITWSGYNLDVPALGISPRETLDTTYSIYDLNRDSLLWNGSVRAFEQVDLGEATAKEYIEKNDLSGLKKEVGRMISEKYKIRTDHGINSTSVGQYIGLQDNVAAVKQGE